METDYKTQVIDALAKLDPLQPGLDKLKEALNAMIHLIQSQDEKIKNLEQRQNNTDAKIIGKTNDIHDLQERVLTLERYSRKTCLVFIGIDNPQNPIEEILNLLNNVMRLSVQPHDLAAIHPLSKSPKSAMIVKFIYHYQRDLVWRRKSWLKEVRNCQNHLIIIEGTLAPADREIKNEARQRNIQTLT